MREDREKLKRGKAGIENGKKIKKTKGVEREKNKNRESLKNRGQVTGLLSMAFGLCYGLWLQQQNNRL